MLCAFGRIFRLRKSLSEYNLDISSSLPFDNISSNEIIISAIPREQRKLDSEIGNLATKFKPLLVVPLLLWHFFWGAPIWYYFSRQTDFIDLHHGGYLLLSLSLSLSLSFSLPPSLSLYLAVSK